MSRHEWIRSKIMMTLNYLICIPCQITTNSQDTLTAFGTGKEQEDRRTSLILVDTSWDMSPVPFDLGLAPIHVD